MEEEIKPFDEQVKDIVKNEEILKKRQIELIKKAEKDMIDNPKIPYSNLTA